MTTQMYVEYSKIRDQNDTDFPLVLYLTRVSLIVVDTLMLVLTWNKTYRQWKESRRLGISVSVSTCLLRDGKYHFVAGRVYC